MAPVVSPWAVGTAAVLGGAGLYMCLGQSDGAAEALPGVEGPERALATAGRKCPSVDLVPAEELKMVSVSPADSPPGSPTKAGEAQLSAQLSAQIYQPEAAVSPAPASSPPRRKKKKKKARKKVAVKPVAVATPEEEDKEEDEQEEVEMGEEVVVAAPMEGPITVTSGSFSVGVAWTADLTACRRDVALVLAIQGTQPPGRSAAVLDTSS
jgi:hypothetical protein